MGIKNSTVPANIEQCEQGLQTSVPPIFQNVHSNEMLSHSNSNVPKIFLDETDSSKIINSFTKLRNISTLVLKCGIHENDPLMNSKPTLTYEIYETLNEEILYTGEQQGHKSCLFCFVLTPYPIIIIDHAIGLEIARISNHIRIFNGHKMKVLEICSQNKMLGYILTLPSKNVSHEIKDKHDITIFAIEKRTLGFQCYEYRVTTVNAIELSVCVAIVRAPREGKVFTEMHTNLSATSKALLMSFSLYILTLNE